MIVTDIWRSMSTAPRKGETFMATILWGVNAPLTSQTRSVIPIHENDAGQWEGDGGRTFGPADRSELTSVGDYARPICWRPKTKADEPFEGDPAELEQTSVPIVKDPALMEKYRTILQKGAVRMPVYIGMDVGKEPVAIYGGPIEVSSSHGLHEHKIGRILRDETPDRADAVRDALLYALRWHSVMHVPVNHVSNLMTKLGDDILNNVMRTMFGRLNDKYGLRVESKNLSRQASLDAIGKGMPEGKPHLTDCWPEYRITANVHAAQVTMIKRTAWNSTLAYVDNECSLVETDEGPFVGGWMIRFETGHFVCVSDEVFHFCFFERKGQP